jgi:hypothetical protein
MSRLASHRLVETNSFHKLLASCHRPSSPSPHYSYTLLTIVLVPFISVASRPLAMSPLLYVETLSYSTDLAMLYKNMYIRDEFRISSTCVYPILVSSNPLGAARSPLELSLTLEGLSG